MTSPLIVGIDPGTTTGVALFDLEGNFLLVESGKHFTRAAIRKFIFEHGSPVIIASDMNPLPRSIEKIASSFSSRVIIPEGVLSRKDKRRIAGNFLKAWEEEVPWRNQHEKDAVVAGWYAWKRIRGTVSKIEKKLENRDERLRNYVKGSILVEGGNVQERVKEFLKQKQSIK